MPEAALAPGARIALLRLALAREPDDVDRRYDLAEALLDAGQAEEGSALFKQAFRAAPALRPCMPDDLAVLGRADMIARLSTRAGMLLEHGANYSPVLWSAAIAAACQGDAERVRYLMDYGAHFRASPAGLSALHTAAFRAALADELRGGMQRYRLDDWTALRDARRNSRIFANGGPACDALSGAVINAVRAYALSLPAGSLHPLCASRPARVVLSGWCVTFDRASRHISHIHPRGWISGVFYVAAPSAARDPAARRGWLRVGPPAGVPVDAGWDERWVAPEPGTLVLMPSFYAHETTPAESDEERLCVAFDVMSEDLAGPIVAQGGAVTFDLGPIDAGRANALQ